MKRRKIRKPFWLRFNSFNVSVSLLAVFTSYFIVTACGAVPELNSYQVREGGLTHSAIRLAEAFEEYNQKRFLE